MAALVAGSQVGCGVLPLRDLEGHIPVNTSLDMADTQLGRTIAPLTAAHPGTSGILPLTQGRNAFAARSLLADAADRTLDLQYYIWHGDMSGTLLFESVHRAADRGVRVRLLLDDNNTVGLDRRLLALDAHPQIEVRLFNPFVNRRWRWLGFLSDFSRLNRRMHNKSFTADKLATIVGGRNIGDEYFGASGEMLFVDLDVLAVGPVVDDVSSDFDRYWTSASSYPAASILKTVGPSEVHEITEAASLVQRDPAAHAYVQAIENSTFMRELLAARLPLEWAPTRLVSDDPAKGLRGLAKKDLLTRRMAEALGRPVEEIHLVSPYFVPGRKGVDYFRALAVQGVKVAILTNSLEATDVAAVHAGYAKRRKPLLKAGVRLYEMKRSAAPMHPRTPGIGGSSVSSLHAKTFAVDRSRVFIGSFNFDPRSSRLNTEMGFVIESPWLAGKVADASSWQIPVNAYQVRFTDDGELQWVELRDGKELVHDVEPGTSFLDRAGVAILSILPIEWLL